MRKKKERGVKGCIHGTTTYTKKTPNPKSPPKKKLSIPFPHSRDQLTRRRLFGRRVRHADRCLKDCVLFVLDYPVLVLVLVVEHTPSQKVMSKR
jgi:hypothetical protein